LLEGLRGKDFSQAYNKAALERCLHLAIECVIDIGEIIISKMRLEPAPTYKDVILRLGEKQILDEAFASRFSAVASLRNILVHDYVRVDVKRLAGFLDHLDDFRQFARQVSRHLE